MADQAPFPADWALSRLVDVPARVYGHTYTQDEQNVHQHRAWMESKTTGNLHMANCQFLLDQSRYTCVPVLYRRLLDQTKIMATTVSDLARVASRLGLSMWAEAARLLVDYSASILNSKTLGIEKFLFSQRESIYWILDDTLLRLCLDQWEDDAKRKRWDEAVGPITLAVREAMGNLQGWLGAHLMEMRMVFALDSSVLPERLTAGYFTRSQEFLRESARVFEIERTVRLSRMASLPAELADIILDDVLSFEKVRVGHELRTAYLSKGKGKAVV